MVFSDQAMKDLVEQCNNKDIPIQCKHKFVGRVESAKILEDGNIEITGFVENDEIINELYIGVKYEFKRENIKRNGN